MKMIDEEILGGLKSAIARGESLEKAMMTFYNAGYPKVKIEEAARTLQMHERQPIQTPPKKNIISFIQKPRKLTRKEIKEKKKLEKLRAKQKPLIPIKQRPQPIQSPQPQPQLQQKQQISHYGEQDPKGKLLIVILVFLLFFLLAILGTIFFFKDELVDIFDNLFQNALCLFTR
jgi:hypothetical protein